MPLAKADFAGFMSMVKLPEDWGWEVWIGPCITLIPPPSVDGHVTIDVRHRLVVIGIETPQKTDDSPTYKGRGWRQQIVNDAVAQLLGAQRPQ